MLLLGDIREDRVEQGKKDGAAAAEDFERGAEPHEANGEDFWETD